MGRRPTHLSTARFDRDASRYHRGVYERKRADLLQQIHTTLHLLFLGQLKNLHKIALSTFKQKVKEGVGREGYDFGEVVKSSREFAEGFFLTGAQGSFELSLVS
jgi:protein SEY1